MFPSGTLVLIIQECQNGGGDELRKSQWLALWGLVIFGHAICQTPSLSINYSLKPLHCLLNMCIRGHTGASDSSSIPGILSFDFLTVHLFISHPGASIVEDLPLPLHF